jgi:protein SCO1/2
VNRRFIALVALCALAGILAAGLASESGVLRPRPSTPAVGGPFNLVDQTGRKVDEGLLKGKWSLVFFGFTYCPDVCPTTLLSLAQAEDRLGPKAKDLQTVFISVDPGRDTPQQLKLYLSNDAFPKHVVGLTGTLPQVDAVAKVYRVYFQKSGDGPDYVVNHSTPTYLMSPKGRFVCVIPYGLTPEQTAERVDKAMREGASATNC